MKKIVLIALCILPFLTFAQDTLVKWTFPNNPDDSIADGGIPANAGMMISANGGTSAMNFTYSGLTTMSAYATKWNSGNGTKYWQIKVVTLGYINLKISSKQKSSGTGPRDFKVQYKNGFDSTWFDVPGAAVLDSNDWTHGVLTNIPLPIACNNQDTVYLRWIMTSNTSVTGSTVASGGTSRIDDIFIKGTPTIDVIPPTVLEASAISFSTIKVRFSEAVDTTAENIANYTGLASISSAVRNATLDTVLLTLATPLLSGVPDTLIISNVRDTSNNPMSVPQSFQVIFGAIADTAHPIVLKAYATSLAQVKVKFSEPVNGTAEYTFNYTGIGTISSAVRSISLDTVTLTLSTPLLSGVPDTLTVANIHDTSGNSMYSPQNFKILWGNPNSQNIVITEIMYNLPSNDTLEFIELYNNSSSEIGLNNFKFSSGVNFTFPDDTIQSHDFYLLAVDSVKFFNFFNKTARKWTSGSLSNTGEAIIIKDNYGELVDSVHYLSGTPWPTAANGHGASLTLCNPNLDNSLASSWQASAEFVDSVNHVAVYATPGTGCITTGIENNTLVSNNINCFPNPVSDNLTLTIEGMSKEISIYDILGNLVYFNNKPVPVNHINSKNLKNGIYFIKVTFDNNAVVTKKLSVM